MITYYILHPQASTHCHTKVEEDQQASWMPLGSAVNTFCRTFWPRSALTDIPPGVPCFVHLHPRSDNVGGIAKEWQPHVFDVKIVERLPYSAVEFVTLINEINAVSPLPYRRADRCVCDDGVSHVREEAPYITHPPAKLFSSRGTGDNITFPRIKSTDKRSDAGTCGSRPCKVQHITVGEHIPPI